MRCQKIPPWTAPLLCFLVLIVCRDLVGQAVQDGIRQCLTCVIPSLFPFFVLSAMLVGSDFPDLVGRKCGPWIRRWFHLPSAGASACLIGLLGGYPVGAKTAVQLWESGRIRKKDITYVVAACNNTGPAIFFGLAGGFFDNMLYPLALYLIHIVSAALTAYILRPRKFPESSYGIISASEKISFSAAVWQAAVSCGKISAFVIVFSILIRMLFCLVTPVSPFCRCLLAGILDLPNGLFALRQIDQPALRFVLCSAIINWGGLCVHLQTRAVTEAAGISMGRHCAAKATMSIVSVLISWAVWNLQPGKWQTGLFVLCLMILLIFIKSRVEIHRRYRYNKEKMG